MADIYDKDPVFRDGPWDNIYRNDPVFVDRSWHYGNHVTLSEAAKLVLSITFIVVVIAFFAHRRKKIMLQMTAKFNCFQPNSLSMPLPRSNADIIVNIDNNVLINKCVVGKEKERRINDGAISIADQAKKMMPSIHTLLFINGINYDVINCDNEVDGNKTADLPLQRKQRQQRCSSKGDGNEQMNLTRPTSTSFATVSLAAAASFFLSRRAISCNESEVKHTKTPRSSVPRPRFFSSSTFK